MKRIAVLIVHGVEVADPAFAATPTRLLREAFAKRLGPRAAQAADALVVQPAHLAAVLEDQQRAFFRKTCPGGGEGFLSRIHDLVRRVNAGSRLALVPILLSILNRRSPLFPNVNWPTARWVLAHFLGDAVAYQASPGNREIYDQLHRAYAEALAVLAEKAGPDAPLCVIAHSFGTIISSDFFYDRETERRTAKPVAPFRRRASTALERGETLTWLYTMGSPMALWSLRYPAATLDAPIAVPAPEMVDREELKGEWVNLIDDDDLAAWPLTTLGPEYAGRVEDRRVRVRAGFLGWTPFVHPFYWSDRRVMRPIGERLADAWLALQGGPIPVPRPAASAVGTRR